FLIRKALFGLLGGYDERYCGRYGGDDIDFNERYDLLCQKGVARPAEIGGEGHFYPDPAQLPDLFHRLSRDVAATPTSSPEVGQRPIGTSISRKVVVQVVGPSDNWVLETIASRLAAKLPYAQLVSPAHPPDGSVKLRYYVNYALYVQPSGVLDVGFFTHRDEA